MSLKFFLAVPITCFISFSLASPGQQEPPSFNLPDMVKPSCYINSDKKTKLDIIKTLVKSGIEINFNNKKYTKSILEKSVRLYDSARNKRERHKGIRIVKGWDRYRKASVRESFSECTYKAKYRLTGDLSDHQDITLSSVKVKLKGGSLGGIKNFKLLLPKARGGKAEVLANYIFHELGFLAPRTGVVQVRVNDTFLVNRIFQEDLDKNFLEHNKIHESFIFGGNENFGLARGFSTPKIKNDSLIANNNDRLIAESKLYTLAQVYLKTSLFNLENREQKNPHILSLDEALNPDFFPPRSSKELRRFTILSFAMNLELGLSKDDSRFVYDHVSERFRPIYYDGHAQEIRKLEVSEFAMPFKIDSADIAALMKKINKLDPKKVAKDLVELGANYSPMSIKAIINTISYNLKGQYSIASKLSSDIDDFDNLTLLSNWVLKNKQSEQLFLLKLDENSFKKCLVKIGSNTSCETISINQDRLILSRLLVSQRLDKVSESLADAIFIDFFSKKHKFNSTLKRLDPAEFNGVEFMVSDDLTLDISEADRTIMVHRRSDINDSNLDSQLHIRGGSIVDWLITAQPGIFGYQSKGMLKSYSNYLSGCITLSDINLKNVDIKVADSICEDGVHFVRVKGENVSVHLSNLFSDGIDSDFSNIEFDRLKIHGAGNDCIDLSAGRYDIDDAELFGCSDKGISAGEKSYVAVSKLLVHSAGIGVASKDSSVVEIGEYLVKDTFFCFASYQKKINYGGGKIALGLGECENFKIFEVFRQEGSVINN